MTPTQVALLQASWKQVAPIADQAAELLYGRLFELDPSLRPLFRGDMTEQGRRLMSMMTFVVGSLTRFESLVPAVQALGRRHAGYGVEDQHYETVESALIWTLKQGLGAAFSKEVEEAWRTAYGVLATTMKEAATQSTREAIHATESAAS
jgi:hemoglobin-like flavoprotein